MKEEKSSSTQVLITLGSNINKEINLPRAVGALRGCSELTIISCSRVYESIPIGSEGQVVDQPIFHNAAVRAETTLSPYELRTRLREIESELGRIRSDDKFAPRTIDLDIALYGMEVLDCEEMTIPDPDITRFLYVAVPLADVAPKWCHPLNGKTLEQIAQHLSQSTLAETLKESYCDLENRSIS